MSFLYGRYRWIRMVISKMIPAINSTRSIPMNGNPSRDPLRVINSPINNKLQTVNTICPNILIRLICQNLKERWPLSALFPNRSWKANGSNRIKIMVNFIILLNKNMYNTNLPVLRVTSCKLTYNYMYLQRIIWLFSNVTWKKQYAITRLSFHSGKSWKKYLVHSRKLIFNIDHLYSLLIKSHLNPDPRNSSALIVIRRLLEDH